MFNIKIFLYKIFVLNYFSCGIILIERGEIRVSVEDKLREMINDRYGSVRQFAIQTNLPYTTVLSILDRGVLNAKTLNVFKMCENLSINIESLKNGKIRASSDQSDISLIYSQLHPQFQRKVYHFAEKLLNEQNSHIG